MHRWVRIVALKSGGAIRGDHCWTHAMPCGGLMTAVNCLIPIIPMLEMLAVPP